MDGSVNERGLPRFRCRLGKWVPKKHSRYRVKNAFADKTLQLRRELMFGVVGHGGDNHA
jgi:hypothetical protein